LAAISDNIKAREKTKLFMILNHMRHGFLRVFSASAFVGFV
jgi:hypothetical protein